MNKYENVPGSTDVPTGFPGSPGVSSQKVRRVSGVSGRSLLHNPIILVPRPLIDRTPDRQLVSPSFLTIWTFSPGGPRGQSPSGTLGATGEGLDSCKDSESGC